MDLKQIEFYTIDLAEISGGGEFVCPSCGIEISPDDKTENVYTILEVVKKGDYLERMILRCNRCAIQLHLVGFGTLNKK